jgi:hypothetical protein
VVLRKILPARRSLYSYFEKISHMVNEKIPDHSGERNLGKLCSLKGKANSLKLKLWYTPPPPNPSTFSHVASFMGLFQMSQPFREVKLQQHEAAAYTCKCV